MIVEWTLHAKHALDETVAYVIEDFGWEAGNRFLNSV